MKALIASLLVLLLLSGCASRHHFPDEGASDVWGSTTVSKGTPPLDGHLSFVGVSGDGVLTMKYVSDREYLVTGKPGEYLRSESGQIAYKVISVSTEKNSAVVSFLVSTTRPTY
jgi:hypothetical protein